MEQMEDIYFDSFWFQLLKNDSERKIWHPEIEIIFLLQGKGRIYFSDLKMDGLYFKRKRYFGSKCF